MNQRNHLAIVLGGLLSVLVSTQLFAQQDMVDKRKEVMQSNNADVKAIGKAAEAKDYATIRLKAKEIVENIDKYPSVFPKGSTNRKIASSPGYLGQER